jgi:hypothetical protein
MSSNFNNYWQPYSNTGQTERNVTNNDQVNVLIQNYMNALSNMKKIQTDVSFCLMPGSVNDIPASYAGVLYRDYNFNDGGKLHLPTSGVPGFNNVPSIQGGTPNGSSQISFAIANSQTPVVQFGSSDINAAKNDRNQSNDTCSVLYNNAAVKNNVFPSTIVNAGLDVSHGLYNYIYYEYMQAEQALNNYIQSTGSQYTLTDIDASYQSIQEMRNHIDNSMRNLYEVNNSIPDLYKQQYDATIFSTLLWTILAIVILYYVFIKLYIIVS